MEKSVINQIQNFFSHQPVEKVWLFGSYSRGEETRDSDIDILVRFDSKETITLFKYAGMVDSLEKLLHTRIDLVEEGELKDFAKDSAEQEKILIYERKK